MRPSVKLRGVSTALALAVLLVGSAPSGAQTAGQGPTQSSTAQAAPESPTVGQRLEALSAPVIAGLMLAIAISFGLLLVIDLWRGGAVAIESSWGGFGGGLGGWRLSPGLVYLVGLLVFGSISSIALLRPSERSQGAPASTAGPSTPVASTSGRQGGAPATAAGEQAQGAAPTTGASVEGGGSGRGDAEPAASGGKLSSK